MANRIVAVEYESNAGNTFVTGLNEEVFDQGSGDPLVRLVGGAPAPANAAYDPLPMQMQPRRAVCVSAAGKTREVILLTPTAPLATLGTAINLEDSDGATAAFTSVAIKQESYRRRKQQT